MFINVDTANEKAVNILQNAHVYLTGIATAKDVIPFLAQDKALLHSGPPIVEEEYGFYMDLRKYGSTRHSGFGLGFERCVMYLTGMGNIRDVIPFPRTVNNCDL